MAKGDETENFAPRNPGVPSDDLSSIARQFPPVFLPDHIIFVSKKAFFVIDYDKKMA